MFVIPRQGLSVVDPTRMDVLPPEGRDVGVEHPSFWVRRLGDGDVTEVKGDDAIKAAKDALEKGDTKRAADARLAAEAADKARAEAAAEEAKAKTEAPKQTAPIQGTAKK